MSQRNFGNRFSISQFSKLTGIPKQTLQFYDNKGIFSPATRLDNGYRYYEADQYDSIDIIYALKEAGLSLSDIKAYLENRTPEKCLHLIDQESIRIQSKIHALERTLKQLEEKRYSVNRGLSITQKHKIHIDTLCDRHLIVWDFRHIAKEDFMLEIIQMMNWCYENGFYTGYATGAILEQHYLECQNYDTIQWVFMPIEKPADHPNYRCQLAGLYAIYYYEGGYEDLPRAYESIAYQLKEMGYQITGDAYETGLLDFFSVRNPKEYLLEIAIPVRKILP